MKKVIQVVFFTLPLFVLTGCPLMMAVMMPGMMGMDLLQSEDAKVEAAVRVPVQEGVAALDKNRGTYEGFVLEKAKVNGPAMKEEKFRHLLLEELATGNKWQVVDGLNRAGYTEEAKGPVLAFLNTQLDQEKDLFRLTIEIGDLDTGEVLWAGTFSKPIPSSSHAH